MERNMKLTVKQDAFVLGYLETGNASEAYRRAYDCQNMKEHTINNRASELLRHSGIKARVEELRERTVSSAVLQKADVINLITEIATADASHLSQIQVRNCRHCWGLGHRYHWTNATEFAFRCAEVSDSNAAAIREHERMTAGSSKHVPPPKPREMPTDEGGYGFVVTNPPNPECPSCLGEGHEVIVFRDTRHLKGAAKRLFAGVKKTKEGIEIKQRDQDKALEMLAKIHGVLLPDAPPASTGPTINNNGGTVNILPADPLEASRAYQELMKGS
jgi:phage terminase small subunit